MFKAIKDNKIIAISDKADFSLLDFDSVVEEEEHSVEDYVHIDGQFVLTTSNEAIELKQVEARAERDRRIDAVRWRIERYQTQAAAGLETTDTAEQYQTLLIYVQALRDVPGQEGFPDNVVWPAIGETEENTENVEEPTASDQT